MLFSSIMLIFIMRILEKNIQAQKTKDKNHESK